MHKKLFPFKYITSDTADKPLPPSTKALDKKTLFFLNRLISIQFSNFNLRDIKVNGSTATVSQPTTTSLTSLETCDPTFPLQILPTDLDCVFFQHLSQIINPIQKWAQRATPPSWFPRPSTENSIFQNSLNNLAGLVCFVKDLTASVKVYLYRD